MRPIVGYILFSCCAWLSHRRTRPRWLGFRRHLLGERTLWLQEGYVSHMTFSVINAFRWTHCMHSKCTLPHAWWCQLRTAASFPNHVILGMRLLHAHLTIFLLHTTVQRYLGRGPVYLVPGQKSSRKRKQRILFLVSFIISPPLYASVHSSI